MIIGKLHEVTNLAKKGNAPNGYQCLPYLDEHGSLQYLLMTTMELRKSRNRASKNPEDLPELTWKDKLYMLLFSE